MSCRSSCCSHLAKCDANFHQIYRKSAKENANESAFPFSNVRMLEVPCDKQLVVLILQPGAIKPLQEAGAK